MVHSKDSTLPPHQVLPSQTEWDKVHQDLFPQSETLRTSVRGLQREPYNRLVFNIQLSTVPSTGISVHYSDYTLD